MTNTGQMEEAAVLEALYIPGDAVCIAWRFLGNHKEGLGGPGTGRDCLVRRDEGRIQSG
jgi:hypothetical protein